MNDNIFSVLVGTTDIFGKQMFLRKHIMSIPI